MEKEADGYKYVYQFKDHLGNIRLSYKDANDDKSITQDEIIEEKNYYPFGLQHEGYNFAVNGRKHSFDFLGQERQEELGLNWVSFRHRNGGPSIGRFFGIDPVSADYVSISTYQFAHNNPVWKIELEGLEGATTSGEDTPNYEPVGNPSSHIPLPIGDTTAGNYGSEPVYTTFNTGSGGREPMRGFINPSSEGAYGDDPVRALVTDITFIGLSLIGLDALDEAIVSQVDPEASTGEKVQAAVNVIPALIKGGKGKGTAPLSRTGRPLPKAQTNGGRALDPKTGQPLGGSGKARPVTVKTSSYKKAKDAARNSGSGSAVKHTQDSKGGNHFHTGKGKRGKGKGTKKYGSRAGKVGNNVHYEYPKNSSN
ncbi:RHS repeat domain-containing protein [Aquimarina longa]|uniref:RHS repeat domain-containing protein n=1 Tax=Aquimarina longa TaxID=1080221 RepID=UPI000785DEFC|nr:RHS repeat-associated core domain-containing protein [Aquimarina longa]